MTYDEHAEAKETLKAHRRKGAGSHGGKGAYKRKNPGKEFLRRLSAAEQRRQDDRVSAIAKHCRVELNKSERHALHQMLERKLNTPVDQLRTPAMFLTAAETPVRQEVIRATQRYLAAVIFAYAVYQYIGASGESQRKQYVKTVSEKTRIPLTENFNLLRAVLRLVIDYEDKNPGSDNRRKLSRDALAIEYLIDKGVHPHRVQAFQKKHGGGVDLWSRLANSPETLPKQKREIEIAGREIERDRVSSFSNADMDDEATDTFSWGSLKSIASKTEARLGRLAKQDIWVAQMLSYYREHVGVIPGEAVISLVVGDPKSPSGVALIETFSLGRTVLPAAKLRKRMPAIVQAAEAALKIRKHDICWNYIRKARHAAAEKHVRKLRSRRCR